MANVVTTEGKNDTLTQYFKGSAYTATWFVGLVNNAGFTAFAATDTAAQINGTNQWTEWTTYSESVRQTLTLGTPSAGSVDNSASKAVFTQSGSGTLNGAFIVSSSTKAGTAGKLYGAGSFSATRAVVSTDVVSVTATLSQT